MTKRSSALLLVVLVLTSCRSLRSEPKCRSFAGDATSARWSGCSDKVKREVRCAPGLSLGMQVIALGPNGPSDTPLTCDCLEDGALRFSFRAKDPPLASRDDATRLANANCHWSLAAN